MIAINFNKEIHAELCIYRRILWKNNFYEKFHKEVVY